MFGFVTLPEPFWVGVTGSVIFGLIGIFLLLLGFKLFDWLLPKVDFQDVLRQSPVGTAVVVGAFFLAVAHIIASVVH